MRIRRLIPLLAAALLLHGCAAKPSPKEIFPPLPSASAEPPVIRVYVTGADAVVEMDVETYVAGVVAGEMRSDWPMEALKAQAILARTFVLKFLTEKTSRYPGADISTDIREAQAYDTAAVNERILAAVQDTAGEILLTADGQLPYTWFHAHSGGTTALARESLDWQGGEPGYTAVMPGMDSSSAPDSAKAWAASFPERDFIAACQAASAQVTSCESVTIGEKGPSGRAVTLLVDGVEVNAARLRISLGSAIMRSTLLTELTVEDGVIRMAGRGYGHGVGMPQWGAYALAEDGMAAEDIALHYYRNLQIVRAW